MTINVQNNSSALLALQNLNRTTDELNKVQDRVSTQLLVGQPKDNPSVWATAQGQGSQIDGLASVTTSLNRATSISDVAVSAGQTVLDLLNQMKQKALTGGDPQLQQSELDAVNVDFKTLLARVQTTINSASFDGANLLNGSSGDLRFLANAQGNQVVTLSAENISLGGAIITLPSTASLPTASTASAIATQLDASIANLTKAMTNLGDQAKLISNHTALVSKLSDVLKVGQGTLVNADTAADSARLAALQVQQQLSSQSLSIANSMPQVLLGLFK